MPMSQVVQILGALAILAAFVAAQLGIFDVRSRTYLWLNLLGALVLASVAWHEQQFAFCFSRASGRSSPLGGSSLRLGLLELVHEPTGLRWV